MKLEVQNVKALLAVVLDFVVPFNTRGVNEIFMRK